MSIVKSAGYAGLTNTINVIFRAEEINGPRAFAEGRGHEYFDNTILRQDLYNRLASIRQNYFDNAMERKQVERNNC